MQFQASTIIPDYPFNKVLTASQKQSYYADIWKQTGISKCSILTAVVWVSGSLFILLIENYCFSHFIKGGKERPIDLFEPVAVCLPAPMLSGHCGRLHAGWAAVGHSTNESRKWEQRESPLALQGQTFQAKPPLQPRQQSPAARSHFFLCNRTLDI